MTHSILFPIDAFVGSKPPDLDLAADFLELVAATSDNRQALSSDIVDEFDFAAEREMLEIGIEDRLPEQIASGAVDRINTRISALADSYPFSLDDDGYVTTYTPEIPDIAQTSYLVSLLLSNLKSITPLLECSDLHPIDEDARLLRQYFEYFATAALAAEVRGPSWSFGAPRSDGSGFMRKLEEIWSVLQDGTPFADEAAPRSPKDDGVDVFACRMYADKLPGFLFAAAQVATGKDWRQKPLKHHVNGTFKRRWFRPEPVTWILPYHIVPFALLERTFRDDVDRLGNVMHRIRVPRRVSEAADLVSSGVMIEAYDKLQLAVDWTHNYLLRARNL